MRLRENFRRRNVRRRSLAIALLLGLAGSHCLQIDPSPLDSSRDPVALLATYLLNPVPESPVYGVRVGGFQKISATAGGFSGPLDDGDSFGVSINSPGDLNGDGIPDLLVGANFDDDGGVDRGAVHVLYMNRDGTVQYSQKISATEGGLGTGLDDGDIFGVAVYAGSDFNGDGLVDPVVGADLDDDGGTDRGAVYVLFLERIEL